MTINHKVDVNIKHFGQEVKEALKENKDKIKIGAGCLIVGMLIGYKKGLNNAVTKIIISTDNITHF